MAFLWDTATGGKEMSNLGKAALSLGIKGNRDSKVSPFLKAWIMQGTTCVVGLIGEGTSRELSALWGQPFMADSLGTSFSKAGALTQIGSQRTSMTTFNSRQVWQGNGPHTFTLSLVFYALSDAKAEVMDAIAALEEMMTPDINQNLPGGRIPQPVMINIGRNAILSDCIIKSMSTPLDGERTKQGHLVRATVALQIETLEMVNLDKIVSTFA